MKARCIAGILILSALSITTNKCYACRQHPHALLSVSPDPQVRGEEVTFDATGSYDPDGGPIIQYCWWWDWPDANQYDCESPGDKKYEYPYNTCGQYKIRLQVKDNEYWTGNTYYEGLKIIPPAPNLVSPEDNSTCIPVDNIRLIWDSDPCAGSSYDVYLGTSNNPNFHKNVDSNYLDIDSLQAGMTYNWRIETVDNDQNSYSIDTWSFSTGPSKATNPNPGDGVTGVPIDANLSWTPGGVAVSHDVYFGTDFNDINNAGITSGQFKGNTTTDYYDTRRIRAFLFDDNKMADIGSLGRAYEDGPNTTTWAEAFAINESGRIVGVSTDPNGNPHAFINIPSECNEPNWTSPLTDLHSFSGIDESIAYGISDSNRIVGSAGDKAFYLKYPGDMNELPNLYSETDQNSVARAVTDGADGTSPTAVGWSGGHAALWDNLDSNQPNIYDLGTVKKYCKSRAYNINKYRQIVGYFWPKYDAAPKDRAFVGDIENGLTDIGTLQQGNISRAYGINNAGQVVGEATVDSNDDELRAIIYDDCQMFNLNELIETGPNDPCYVFISAKSINDDGFIVGYGKVSDSNDPNSSFSRAILLVPIRPVAHWEFDETFGNTAADSSLRGNHGNVHGPTWTTGKIRGALSFDGQNDYVTTESMVLDPGIYDFTVTVWVKLDVNDVNQVLVSQDGGTQWLQISGNNKLCTELGGVTDSNGTILKTKTWYHVALAKSANKVNFYINGSFDGTQDQIIGEVDSATGNMVFGSNKECDGNFFDGIMDDLRIYPWALTQTEIMKLFSGEM